MSCTHERQYYIRERLPCASTKCPDGIQGQLLSVFGPPRKFFERRKSAGGLVWVDDIGRHASHEPFDPDRFPHVCRKCGAPAYNGFNSINCSAGCS